MKARHLSLSTTIACAVIALTVGIATATAGRGNSANAKKCQKNGSQTLVTSTGSQSVCISYVSGNGVVYKPTLTALPATGKENENIAISASGFHPSSSGQLTIVRLPLNVPSTLVGVTAPPRRTSDCEGRVVVEGGPDGICARRPVTSHTQGYVYDLWLVERLADRRGA